MNEFDNLKASPNIYKKIKKKSVIAFSLNKSW